MDTMNAVERTKLLSINKRQSKNKDTVGLTIYNNNKNSKINTKQLTFG
jgi:hypothetical protein